MFLLGLAAISALGIASVGIISILSSLKEFDSEDIFEQKP